MSKNALMKRNQLFSNLYVYKANKHMVLKNMITKLLFYANFKIQIKIVRTA